jgi:dihydroorotate dehydrogenase (fumarate)
MTDLSMQYLGMKLSGPIVVASTPLSESIDNVRRMEDAGASAIVLTSLFEEQLALESRALDEDLSRGTNSFAESLDFLPELSDYRMTQDGYLEHLKRAGEAVDIPIMASLNGATSGGWVRLAKEMEQAGANAIELNTFAVVTDRNQTADAIDCLSWSQVSAAQSRFLLPSSSRNPSPVCRIFALGSRKSVRAAWYCSTAFISLTSTSKRWKCGPRCTFLLRQNCCRASTGRRFSLAISRETSRSLGASTRPKTC